MMTRADYQVLAAAMREGKRELIARGFTDGIAQEAQRIVEANLVEALAADNPRFNRKLFEQEAYPYAAQEGLSEEQVTRRHWDSFRRPVAVAHAEEVLG